MYSRFRTCSGAYFSDFLTLLISLPFPLRNIINQYVTSSFLVLLSNWTLYLLLNVVALLPLAFLLIIIALHFLNALSPYETKRFFQSMRIRCQQGYFIAREFVSLLDNNHVIHPISRRDIKLDRPLSTTYIFKVSSSNNP